MIFIFYFWGVKERNDFIFYIVGRWKKEVIFTDATSVSSTVAARIPGMPTVQLRGRSLRQQSRQVPLINLREDLIILSQGWVGGARTRSWTAALRSA
jgi:hypothetical protein